MLLPIQGIVSGGGGVSADAFIIEWTSTAASQAAKLLLNSAGTYDFTVDWGDGSDIDTITAYDQAEIDHIYADADTYQITMEGQLTHWYSNSVFNMANRISDIIQWGDVGFDTMDTAFRGCLGLTVVTASGAGNFGSITNFGNTFRGCNNLTVLECDKWDITGATYLFNFASNSTLATSNYDDILASFAGQSVNSSVSAHFGTSKYTDATSRATLTDSPNLWTITDGGAE